MRSKSYKEFMAQEPAAHRSSEVALMECSIPFLLCIGLMHIREGITKTLFRYRASSIAHLRLDSWCPRPSQESQCFPGQSILFPQYKYLRSRPLELSFSLAFGDEPDKGNGKRWAGVDEEEKRTQMSPMTPAAIARRSKRDLCFECLLLGFLEIAIEAAKQVKPV